MTDGTLPTPRGPVFLGALRSAVGRTPLWLSCWFLVLIVSAALTLPWVHAFNGALEHRYEPGTVLASMDETFRFDHREELAALGRSGASAAAALSLALMLFGAFTAGGWLQVFLERTAGHSMRRFLWGSARYFWRFVRVLVLTLVALSLVSWICYGWPWKKVVLELLCGAADGELEDLVSERSVVTLEWIQSGLYAALFALVLAWGDYTRTRMALHNSRSTVWAGLCTLTLLLLHPIRTLRPFVLLLACEAVVVIGLGRFSWATNLGVGEGTTWRTILLLLALGQVVLLWQTIVRAARYAAAVAVSRELVQPLAQPDPWAKRIGGPGGPQYPIDDSDEYGVSI